MDSLWNKASLQIYKALGGQVRLVGGCIRDYLLRKPMHDRDMTTPLTPDEVEEALTKAGISFVSPGKKEGLRVQNTKYSLAQPCGFAPHQDYYPEHCVGCICHRDRIMVYGSL